MTVGEVLSKESEKLDLNDAHAQIGACERMWLELDNCIGFPEPPKDMLAIYIGYLTAKHQDWSVGVFEKLKGFWKAYRVKIILKQYIRTVQGGSYKSGDALIKGIAEKIAKWL